MIQNLMEVMAYNLMKIKTKKLTKTTNHNQTIAMVYNLIKIKTKKPKKMKN